MSPHPSTRLDQVVHQRVRLGILTALQAAESADFAYLRTVLELTDGNLARNLRVLEEAGLVRLEKRPDGRRRRTWASLTPAGRVSLAAELAALQELLDELR